MKRWGFRFAVFFACLAVGLDIFQMTHSTGLLPFSNGMAYCTVARNAEAFHDTEVRVRARVIFDDEAMVIYEDCDEVEALASSVAFQGNKSLTNYVDKILVGNTPETRKTATAIVEGTFDAHASTGCWAPKFRITATKIELVSPVTDYQPPDSNGLRQKH